MEDLQNIPKLVDVKAAKVLANMEEEPVPLNLVDLLWEAVKAVISHCKSVSCFCIFSCASIGCFRKSLTKAFGVDKLI